MSLTCNPVGHAHRCAGARLPRASVPHGPAPAALRKSSYHISPTNIGGKTMRLSMRPLLPALVLSAAGFSMANTAQAGCGFAPPAPKPNAWTPSTQASPTLLSAYYRPGADGRFVLTSDDGGWRDEPSIVGMWRFELVTGPTGAVVVDDGYAQWHSDGTEIQNSGLHAPNTGNFCLGVWKQVGPMTYRLNHFPLAWDP